MPERTETIPELDSGVHRLLAAYEAETFRAPDQVEAALDQVNAKLATTAAAGSTAVGMSTTAKVIVASVVLSAGVWIGWGRGPSEDPPAVAAVAQGPSTDNLEGAPSEAAVTVEPGGPLAAPVANTGRPVVVEVGTVAEPGAEPEVVTTGAERERTKTGAITAEPSPTAKPRPTAQRGSAAKPSPTGKRGPVAAPRPTAEPTAAIDPTEEPTPQSLAADLRLLQQARTALRGGHGVQALEHVRRHRQRHPESTFSEERDATEVMALCALGRTTQAKARAVEFQRRFPRSARDVLAGCSP
ncbi:MAG: hypothetical protein K0V04_12300 [Deltaproteobacteria bacterium]|nr:hypothetical protein [Deltaproteobacteria bacterium]